MQKIEITETPKNRLSEIKALWDELNHYHNKRSSHFSAFSEKYPFSQSAKILLANDEIRVFAAKVKDDLVGYCIASINGELGEIDSLYIKRKYRSENIGSELTDRAMQWLKKSNCIEINVHIAEGNESAISFYEKYGFKKKFYVLQN